MWAMRRRREFGATVRAGVSHATTPTALDGGRAASYDAAIKNFISRDGCFHSSCGCEERPRSFLPAVPAPSVPLGVSRHRFW